MQEIITLFLIVVIILAVSAIIPLPTQKAQISPSLETPLPDQAETPKTVPQTGSTISPSQPKKTTVPTTPPPSLIDTYIISGPREGELINETTQVEFEFKAQILSPAVQGQITFETKLEGFDNQWISIYSNKRMLSLPPGPKEYTFLVRAKIGNVIDPTPAKRTFKINTSPYLGKIRISSIQPKTSSYPSLITLSTILQQGEEINITGWQIKGKTGSFIIPGGIEKYNPYYNPVPSEDIFVKQGDKIYLSGGSNPFGKGRNFRPNKCLGYFANYHDLSIPLPKNCPKPTREEISHLDPCCQEFILKLGICEIPDYSSNSRISRDSECVDYLNDNFNYGGCYRKYSRDEDFIGNDWHIYIDKNIVVSDDCDTLYLLDRDGHLVDKYSYGQAKCPY